MVAVKCKQQLTRDGEALATPHALLPDCDDMQWIQIWEGG